MGKLKDMFQGEEIERLQHEWHLEQENAVTKMPVTVRLDGITVVALDKMADHHGRSRQSLVATIIETGLQEVMEGTFSPYDNAEQLLQDFRQECVKTAKQGGYL